MTDQTTPRHVTAMRLLILDAVVGYGAPSRFEALGLAKEVGNLYRWEWDMPKLRALSIDDLMAIYDQLRPGVLEALGRGE